MYHYHVIEHVCSGHCRIFKYTLATVAPRWYRRRRAYQYRQDLMYLSMVICIYISFLLSFVLKCQHHFVVKFWLSGSYGLGLGVGVKSSLVMLHGVEIGA